MSKRAERRHHYYRLKKNRSSYYGGVEEYCKDRYGHHIETNVGRILGMRVSTAKLCSCWGCGNPRRHFKKITANEHRAFLSYADGIEEAFGWKPKRREYNTWW